jgi:hypothetical protein
MPGPKVPTPNQIIEVGFGFRRAKVLLSAIELALFTALGDGPLDADGLVARLGLQGRGARDFFDALVALGFLDRDDRDRYANTAECAQYLDRRKQGYIGGQLEYNNTRLYESWGHLTQALRTGVPQSGPLKTGNFAALHADATAFDIFLKGMTGGSLPPAQALASNFPWHAYRTMIDIGTAEGCVPATIADAHPHLTGGGFDLPEVEQAFGRYMAARGLQSRLKFYPGDFFEDPLPQADVLIMGRILHDWGVPVRQLLLKKVHQALPPNGALIVFDNMIDDARRAHVHGLLASLNMLIHTVGGSEYSGADCSGWMKEAGFCEVRVEQLTATYWAVVATKNRGN